MSTLKNLYDKPILMKGGGAIYRYNRWVSSNPNMNTAEGRYGDAEATILNILGVIVQGNQYINPINGRVDNLSKFWNSPSDITNRLGLERNACQSVIPKTFETALINYIETLRTQGYNNQQVLTRLDEIIRLLQISVNNRFRSGRAWLLSFPELVGGITNAARLTDGHIGFYRAINNARLSAINFRAQRFRRVNQLNVANNVYEFIKRLKIEDNWHGYN